MKTTTHPNPWTADEDAVLRRYYPDGGPQACLPHLNRTKAGIMGRVQRLGIRCTPEIQNPWTADEDAVLRRYYPDGGVLACLPHLNRTRAGIARRVQWLGIRCTPEVQARTRFKVGDEPMNKGKRGLGGKHPNSRRHHFKRGIAFKKARIGDIRRHNTNLVIKVQDEMYSRKNWQLYRHYVWEQHHGAVPRGHYLRVIEGDPLDPENIQVGNLELISLAANARACRDALPAALVDAINKIAALNRIIYHKSKRYTV